MLLFFGGGGYLDIQKMLEKVVLWDFKCVPVNRLTFKTVRADIVRSWKSSIRHLTVTFMILEYSGAINPILCF